MPLPISGPQLKRLYLALFPRYYHISAYVTGCDLEKFFVFENTAGIKATCAFWFI